ncbi:DUF1963 domain-containing protein [Actinomadura sp. GC306]|uniref:DUF1963 domain-containing protein n=1 Tax=Actinomadura sp. GC306 TaxID=2530367 RepID=UPI0010450048|nr:DUF1963 domain-containing protein [Actinomadura sp. GC306]TDC70591.1 DUF1963 domain-containing protein [Actinomadura sp. GC306]
MDITEVFPDLAGHARTAVRLHPRRGNPGVGDSHIGGPLLWPVDEPWPSCHNKPNDWGRLEHPEPVAMVPIAQLYASDIPDFHFPADFDLMQILWCPAHDALVPREGACLRWRRAADVTEVLAVPPAPRQVEEWAMPIPCLLDPEPIVEYPYIEELPRKLQDEIEEWEGEYPAYLYGLSIASGCKVGGGMSWNVTDMGQHPTCDVCGSQARLILQLDSSEWGGESDQEDGPPRWQPVEDTGLELDAYWAANKPTGLVISRFSHGGFYGCSTDHEHPVIFYSQ